MFWTVRFVDAFEAEFRALPREVQNPLMAIAKMLESHGPQLGRPQVDTLNGSRFANMKEIRFATAKGAWRVAFAFDPAREAILLVAGDKSGISQRRFYSRLISLADARYAAYLLRQYH
jgi:hypothetical protein